MISKDEAASLIRKYLSESTELRVFFIAPDRSVCSRLTASVADFNGLAIRMAAPNADHCWIALQGCTFDYGDPREVDESLRDAVSARIAGRLTIFFPWGAKVHLMELRQG